MKLLLALAVLAACGDPPPPLEVSNGRLTARIYPDPAQIVLLVDGMEVWRTEAGGGDGSPPNGFASISSKSLAIQQHFGSYRFDENKDLTVWRAIDKLGAITATADGASFELLGDDTKLGTGTLALVPHVRIVLTVDTGDSVSLSTPMPADEHVVGLGGQSFDVDHRGQHVALWVQEDGIAKDPYEDDNYQGVWFLSGRRHSTHTPMPMLLSSKGYALAVDTNARAVFDLGKEHDTSARFEAWERTLDLHVFLGDPAAPVRDALGQMIAWTGKPATPPPAVFAPWNDAIFGSASVRQVAQALRANGISSSVIWTEDWRGGGDTTLGYALKENWRVDRTLYPDFEQLASDLHGDGFQFLVYHNTFVDSTADVYAEATAAGYPVRDTTGAPYVFTGVKLLDSTILDLSNPASVAWGKSVMGEAVTLGADGWIRKRFILLADMPRLRVEYRLEGRRIEAPGRFGVEVNLAFYMGPPPDRTVEINGEPPADPSLLAVAETARVQEIRVTDAWLGLAARLELDPPARLWRTPVLTISQSEEGYERVAQQIALLPHWVLGGPEGVKQLALTLTIESWEAAAG